MPAVDAILLKCRGSPRDERALVAGLAALALQEGIALSSLHAHVSQAGGEVYGYLELRQRGDPGPGALARLESAAGAIAGFDDIEVRAARLERVFDVPGASRGERALFHYVVETDLAPGSEAEASRWYDTEHMPGLAAVPGTVRAQRFLNLDSGPRSHACYQLVSSETMGSPPWLAVRQTVWSDRVRPNFRNTKRTMFRTLEGVQP